MDRTPTAPSHNPAKPSVVGAFFQGLRSGVTNSTLMMAIFSGIGVIPWIFGGSLMVMGFSNIVLGIAATGIFSGVMGAKKVMDSNAPPANAPAHGDAKSVVIERTKARAKAMEMDGADDRELRTDWSERMGRGGAQERREAILSRGDAEPDYATAIQQERLNAGERTI